MYGALIVLSLMVGRLSSEGQGSGPFELKSDNVVVRTLTYLNSYFP